MRRISRWGASLLIMMFVFSCITINIYFPAAAVQKAADRIVDEVWGEKLKEKRKEQKKDDGKPQSRYEMDGRGLKIIFAFVQEAYAQEADINVTTPAIRSIKRSLKERLELLRPYLDRGNIGLTSDGLLAVRNSAGLSLKKRAEIKRLVEAENRDRNALYLEIARANNISPDRVEDIKRIFAKSWIKKAPSGWWYQGPDGKWKLKK